MASRSLGTDRDWSAADADLDRIEALWADEDAPLGRRWPGGPPLQPCGTWGAYLRHLRSGGEPCEECRSAAREHRHAQKVRAGG